ncbi:LysR family transcriptional regulator [Nocardioides immobilis]|uniref:LysR family transcriptional regulator n=1 Tax=Nocardioides immobilis TaxID=2049295 RepID=A0A417Y0K0_9ACTN|nr:LysR substrate-binding domain-containing protein [Nocardioides immobilis]RHW26182.1 LysR family transcriptional regulator [Nocardioides immobilis]
MELRHLRYFVAVAETCHFGRAAERLHMAQPALSQAIRQLESELGASLFFRTTRQVSLTAAGEFLYDEAQRVLRAVDDSVAGVRRVAEGRKGLARLGFTGTASFTQLPFIARTLQRELPDVALEIHADLLTPEQSDGLRDGSLDLAVLRPPAAGEGVTVRVIEVEPLVLALPAGHRLVAEQVVALADLRTEGFVLYKPSVVNDAVLRTCRDAGFTPRREHEAPGTAVLLALIAAGLGVALVPASARAVPLADVVFRDVADAGTVELALAWRDEPSTLVRSILAVLEAAGLFSDQSDPDLPDNVTEGAR